MQMKKSELRQIIKEEVLAILKRKSLVKESSYQNKLFKQYPGESEPNPTAQGVIDILISNSSTAPHLGDIKIWNTPPGATLKYFYWDELPTDIIKLIAQKYKIRATVDRDEDKGDLISYEITDKK